MDQPVSLSEAKAHLAGLVQVAETGEVVHISRHGKPVAVLISEQAYAALQQQQAGRRLWAAIADWRHGARPGHADDWPLPSGEPGANEVDGWRDRSTGREVLLG
ncbi:MAG: type II toxin-antitoxin system Phd/YefM family antitoxin [Prochlorococcaceae cyanobacterium]